MKTVCLRLIFKLYPAVVCEGLQSPRGIFVKACVFKKIFACLNIDWNCLCRHNCLHLKLLNCDADICVTWMTSTLSLHNSGDQINTIFQPEFEVDPCRSVKNQPKFNGCQQDKSNQWSLHGNHRLYIKHKCSHSVTTDWLGRLFWRFSQSLTMFWRPNSVISKS